MSRFTNSSTSTPPSTPYKVYLLVTSKTINSYLSTSNLRDSNKNKKQKTILSYTTLPTSTLPINNIKLIHPYYTTQDALQIQNLSSLSNPFDTYLLQYSLQYNLQLIFFYYNTLHIFLFYVTFSIIDFPERFLYFQLVPLSRTLPLEPHRTT